MSTETSTARALPAGIIKKTTSYMVDPTKVTRAAGFNPRFDFGEIELLAKSIAANGLLMPIRVKRVTGNDKYEFELVDGDRRLTAVAQLLAKGHVFEDGVPAILVDRVQDDVTSLIQMFEANTGKPFLPLEEAAAYKRMRDAGMTIAQICSRVGRADVHVTDTLSLLEADEDVQDALKAGKIGATNAKLIATIAKGDKAAQKEMTADAVTAKGTTVDAKAAKARLMKKLEDKRAAKAAAKGKTPRLLCLSGNQLNDLGAKVAKHLAAVSKEAKWQEFATLEDAAVAVSKDEALTAAFTLGATMALLVAAGQKIELCR